jgi:hypothetical protein
MTTASSCRALAVMAWLFSVRFRGFPSRVPGHPSGTHLYQHIP